MSKRYEERQVTQSVLVAVQCDRCGKVILADNGIEWQEAFSWTNKAGYGSVWGDGTTVSVDLCQRCTHEIFSAFAVVRDETAPT